jgi:hypothetical protein
LLGDSAFQTGIYNEAFSYLADIQMDYPDFPQLLVDGLKTVASSLFQDSTTKKKTLSEFFRSRSIKGMNSILKVYLEDVEKALGPEAANSCIVEDLQNVKNVVADAEASINKYAAINLAKIS